MARYFPNAASGSTAISLYALNRFASTVDVSLTTAEVLTRLIIPQTLAYQCAYIDIVGSDAVGTPSQAHYVVHAHCSTFATLVRAIRRHFREDDLVEGEWRSTFRPHSYC